MSSIKEDEKNKTIKLFSGCIEGCLYPMTIRRKNRSKITEVSKAWTMDGNEISIKLCKTKNIPFYKNKLLSWEFAIDHGEENYKAVLAGKKLAAVITLRRDSPDDCRHYAEKMTEIVEAVQGKRNICMKAYDHYEDYPGIDIYNYKDKTTVVITREGCLNDYFKLEEVIEAYGRQDCDIQNNEYVRRQFEKPLIDLYEIGEENYLPRYLIEKEFGEAHRKEQAKIIASELALGKPIEITVNMIEINHLHSKYYNATSF